MHHLKYCGHSFGGKVTVVARQLQYGFMAKLSFVHVKSVGWLKNGFHQLTWFCMRYVIVRPSLLGLYWGYTVL